MARFKFVFLLTILLYINIVIIDCKKNLLVNLNEDNWDNMLEGEWMIEFFAPWCPACKALQSVWEDFSSWSDDLGIHVGQVDVTTNPGLSGRFMVTALPTIFHVKDGQFRQYRGSRDKEEFISFIEDKKWSNLDEISAWKSPSSIQMSVVSYFFKLSMVLRSIHNKLVEDYKFPYWASILMFAVATIMIGAMLGLMLVCVVDFVFPPKSPTASAKSAPPLISQTIEKPSVSKDEKQSKEEKENADSSGQTESVPSLSSNNKEEMRKRKSVKKEE